LQLWVALPQADEEVEPAFDHVDAAALPLVTVEGATVRVLVGSAFGAESPVPARSPTLYLDITLPPEGTLHLPPLAAEQAVYSVDEPVRVDGAELGAHVLEVLDGRRTATLVAPRGARLVLVGGEPLGARHIWWNFVSSRRERIAQAASDWDMRRFAAVPGETEFIPLPRRPDWFNPR
jgi:redox-sensitive bicupin YhaK (pirin superfamily)